MCDTTTRTGVSAVGVAAVRVATVAALVACKHMLPTIRDLKVSPSGVTSNDEGRPHAGIPGPRGDSASGDMRRESRSPPGKRQGLALSRDAPEGLLGGTAAAASVQRVPAREAEGAAAGRPTPLCEGARLRSPGLRAPPEVATGQPLHVVGQALQSGAARRLGALDPQQAKPRRKRPPVADLQWQCTLACGHCSKAELPRKPTAQQKGRWRPCGQSLGSWHLRSAAPQPRKPHILPGLCHSWSSSPLRRLRRQPRRVPAALRCLAARSGAGGCRRGVPASALAAVGARSGQRLLGHRLGGAAVADLPRGAGCSARHRWGSAAASELSRRGVGQGLGRSRLGHPDLLRDGQREPAGRHSRLESVAHRHRRRRCCRRHAGARSISSGVRRPGWRARLGVAAVAGGLFRRLGRRRPLHQARGGPTPGHGHEVCSQTEAG
mmetsp:Transcript_1764/g.6951  ORF Transcript_1764/g.6951 Transcript_1764/m.6951 type:complete len:436 (+) Transcript_1764:138-1445(+)